MYRHEEKHGIALARQATQGVRVPRAVFQHSAYLELSSLAKSVRSRMSLTAPANLQVSLVIASLDRRSDTSARWKKQQLAIRDSQAQQMWELGMQPDANRSCQDVG